MLAALKSNHDDSHSQELLKKLAMNKSISGDTSDILLKKYSESSLRLEELLKCVKNSQNGSNLLEIIELKESHQSEIFTLQSKYEESIASLKSQHMNEIQSLKEKIKNLEQKTPIPEI